MAAIFNHETRETHEQNFAVPSGNEKRANLGLARVGKSRR